MIFGIREPVASLTHLVACLAAFYAVGLFWTLTRGDGRRRAALVCFGVSMILLFGASAVYHGLIVSPETQHFLQLVDHSAIYLLIAGTYTPTMYVLLPPSPLRFATLTAIWATALAGIACKWLVDEPSYLLVVGPYVALGWVGTLFYFKLKKAVGMHGLKWVIAGGAAYTLGAVIDWAVWPNPVEFGLSSHDVFHLLAMTGALCHAVFMVKYVAGHRPGVVDVAEATTSLPAATARQG